MVSSAQREPLTVFRSGEDGYRTYRIPAIIRLTENRLLAFCEGRVNGGADFGNVDIVMKYSNDQGKTWSALQVVADQDSLQAGNPAPVVDWTDPNYPAGRIFLFYNTGNAPEAAIRKGKGLREVFYKTSVDGGMHWSDPVNITASVHRPNQPERDRRYQFAGDWRSYANTPGHAIQLRSGPCRGRLYIAANHSSGEPQSQFTDYSSHGYYSDDHGKSFRLAASVPFPGSNEAMAAEPAPGTLLLQFRNQSGRPRLRGIAISHDGGASWDSVYYDQQLPDPVCQGSILVAANGPKKVVLTCNNADTARRNNLTLRVSTNGGKSWQQSIRIDASNDGPGVDFTAYSDMVNLDRGVVGILYERNSYRGIVFRRIRWNNGSK